MKRGLSVKTKFNLIFYYVMTSSERKPLSVPAAVTGSCFIALPLRVYLRLAINEM